MKKIALNTEKLLGFRVMRGAVTTGAKRGGKVGAKMGGKIGIKR